MTVKEGMLVKQIIAGWLSLNKLCSYVFIDIAMHTRLMYYCRTSLKIAIILLPLLGITWVFGLLAVNYDTIAFAWIFTVLNSLQVITY